MKKTNALAYAMSSRQTILTIGTVFSWANLQKKSSVSHFAAPSSSEMFNLYFLYVREKTVRWLVSLSVCRVCLSVFRSEERGKQDDDNVEEKRYD